MSPISTQPAENDFLIGETAISFDDDLHFSDEKKRGIVGWPVLRNKLEERQKKGFYISRLVVKGAAFLGPNNDKLTLLFAQFRYTDTNMVRSTYHGVITPDGAALLEIYRVAKNENTRAKYYATMVVQHRVVLNIPQSLEPPVGFIESGETPVAAARREHKEETGAFKETDGELIKLGSTAPHNLVADRVHFFMAVHDVTPEEFKNVQKQLLDKKGGLKEEGETTYVKLVPLNKAYDDIRASGNSAFAEIHLRRAIDFLKKRNAAKKARL